MPSNSTVVKDLCPSGHALLHNCSGRVGKYVSFCPVPVPFCKLIGSTFNNQDCRVVNYTSMFTQCSCTLVPIKTSCRHLDISSSVLSAVDATGVLNVYTMVTYVASEFMDTFEATPDFSSSAAWKKSLVVVLMFCTLWCGGFGLILAWKWRVKKAMQTKRNGVGNDEAAKISIAATKTRSPAAVYAFLQIYVDEIFPAIFSSKPFIRRLVDEVAKHHRYYTLLTAIDENKKTILTAFQLTTTQNMLMFLLALFYDLQGPTDDGSCEVLMTQSSCVAKKSFLDSSQSYCEWTLVSSSNDRDLFACNYLDPIFTLLMMLYIAVIVSVITALFLRPVDAIFEILFSPSADEEKVKFGLSRMQERNKRYPPTSGIGDQHFWRVFLRD